MKTAISVLFFLISLNCAALEFKGSLVCHRGGNGKMVLDYRYKSIQLVDPSGRVVANGLFIVDSIENGNSSELNIYYYSEGKRSGLSRGKISFWSPEPLGEDILDRRVEGELRLALEGLSEYIACEVSR